MQLQLLQLQFKFVNGLAFVRLCSGSLAFQASGRYHPI